MEDNVPAHDTDVEIQSEDYATVVCGWVLETIPQLEAAVQDGTLPERITELDIQETVGPAVLERYRIIARRKRKCDAAFRNRWIQRFLERFQQSLGLPQAVFPAAAAEAVNLTAKTPPSIRVTWSGGEVTLRPDQVLAARHWGVGFTFQNDLVERLYLDFTVKKALWLLAENLKNLEKLEEALLSEGANLNESQPREVPAHQLDFENLIFDVLNESKSLAEWEDRGNALNTPRTIHLKDGFVVKLSFVDEPVNEAATPSAPKTVTLSFAAVASCALNCGTQLIDGFSWDAFWKSVGGRDHDETSLEERLRALFQKAIESRCAHPLGPLQALPLPVRQIIRAFAHGSTGSQNSERQIFTYRKQRIALEKEAAVAASLEQPQDYPARAAAAVEKAILQLETGIHDGMLPGRIQQLDVQNIIGPHLANRYRVLSTDNLKHDAVFRKYWMQRLLESFRQSLRRPEKVFPATSAAADWNIEQKSPPALRILHGPGEITLRPDQVYSLRGWGLWFSSEDEELEQLYAAFLVDHCQQRLASNVKNLWNIEATYLSGQSNLSATEWRLEERGGRFENLMLDVLNESSHVARPAPFAEDILERTDLRVSYPGIKRKHGARVQVSLAAVPEIHDRKVKAFIVPEEFIFLTPLEFARCAVHPPTHPLFDNFEWADFWASLGGQWRDVHGLAQELYELFNEAISCPLRHPSGALWNVPLPIRQFVRTFTEYYSEKTSHSVSERMARTQRPLESVNKYTKGYWRTRFSQTNPAANPIDRSPGNDLEPVTPHQTN